MKSIRTRISARGDVGALPFRKHMRPHRTAWWALALCVGLFGCTSNNPNEGILTTTGGASSASGAAPQAAASGGTESSGTGGRTTTGGGAWSSGGNAGSGSTQSTGGDVASGGAMPSSGGASASGGSAIVEVDCEPRNVELEVDLLATTTVSSMGNPFPTDEEDRLGPLDWDTQYGKSPEIVPFAAGDGLDILFQDQNSSEYAYVVHIAESPAGYVVDRAYRVQSLGRVMGLTKDSSGNYYVATCVDEEDQVDANHPPNNLHRSNVVRIVKFDSDGCVIMESDVDQQRGIFDPESEILVNPMVASTARLVWGGKRLLLLHGHNTAPDPDIDGDRHQKAIATHIDSSDGTVTRTSTMWVSHSFDQRALFDGTGFVEMHLGDAYPRSITVGRFTDNAGSGGQSLFAIKGREGQNNTYTRLGALLKSDDPDFGYMALFSTERTAESTANTLVSGTRDLALVRVLADFPTRDTSELVVETGEHVQTQDVNSAGDPATNHLRWLTQLDTNHHAERPKMAALSTGELIVLFERYEGNTFEGSFALKLDRTGNVIAGPVELPGQHHLSRGDDIVALGDRVVHVTGGEEGLYLNWVFSDLTSMRTVLP